MIAAGPLPQSSGPALSKPSTASAHREAAERAVRLIYRRFASDALSLQDLAAAAFSSPYHFDRVFRDVTGVSPCHFLAAVRMQAAKWLLVNTESSVTDVCYDVGYNSLGTFTRRFTRLVGLSPRRFRELSRQITVALPSASRAPLLAGLRAFGCADVSPPVVTGCVGGPESFSGLAYVGLFPSAIPEGRPEACGVAAVPGVYRLGPVRDGIYQLMAAALPSAMAGAHPMLSAAELRARGGPIHVRQGVATGAVDVTLRPPLPLDPPIVLVPVGLFRVAGGAQERSQSRRSTSAGRDPSSFESSSHLRRSET